jgi:hypothetical protein
VETDTALVFLGWLVSFTITIQCPRHPTYQGKYRPATLCVDCLLLFAVRNETHKVLSVPREERTDANERLIKGCE